MKDGPTKCTVGGGGEKKTLPSPAAEYRADESGRVERAPRLARNWAAYHRVVPKVLGMHGYLQEVADFDAAWYRAAQSLLLCAP